MQFSTNSMVLLVCYTKSSSAVRVYLLYNERRLLFPYAESCLLHTKNIKRSVSQNFKIKHGGQPCYVSHSRSESKAYVPAKGAAQAAMSSLDIVLNVIKKVYMIYLKESLCARISMPFFSLSSFTVNVIRKNPGSRI